MHTRRISRNPRRITSILFTPYSFTHFRIPSPSSQTLPRETDGRSTRQSREALSQTSRERDACEWGWVLRSNVMPARSHLPCTYLYNTEFSWIPLIRSFELRHLEQIVSFFFQDLETLLVGIFIYSFLQRSITRKSK